MICRNYHEWERELGRLLGIDAPYPREIITRKYRKRRSLGQNAKMHAMFAELAHAMGQSESSVKDWFKDEWGPKIIVTISGKQKTIPKSTANYETMEASEMIERLYQVGGEAGFTFSADEELMA